MQVFPSDFKNTNIQEWKLMPSFLRKSKILEQQFSDLLPNDIIKNQFDDFLAERYGHIKMLNEAQFTDYMVNVHSNEFHSEWIK